MMNLKSRVIVIVLILVASTLVACKKSPNEEMSSDPIVSYEYMDLDGEYTSEVNNWLNDAKRESSNDLHSLSLDDGHEYFYGKGYLQAKVSYTYTDFDGKINRSLKVTLLKGERSDEVLIKVTNNTEVDSVVLDVVDDKEEFY